MWLLLIKWVYMIFGLGYFIVPDGGVCF